MQGAIPTRCPACGGDLQVCLLRCPACRTEVQGDFAPGRFARLSGEQLTFLETFIRLRGSLKDVGAQIGISYPTARNRLDNLIETLGFAAPDDSAARRLSILEQLKNGTLTTEQALHQLQGGTCDE